MLSFIWSLVVFTVMNSEQNENTAAAVVEFLFSQLRKLHRSLQINLGDDKHVLILDIA